MTVNEAIARANDCMGDTVPRDKLLNWLWEIEDTVRRELEITHAGADSGSFCDITADGDALLTGPDPQSELYILYLQMKNDMYLRDTERYMNSAALFAAAYSSYADCVNRERAPLGVSKIKL